MVAGGPPQRARCLRLPVDLVGKVLEQRAQGKGAFEADQRALAVCGWQVLDLDLDESAATQFLGHAGVGNESCAQAAQQNRADHFDRQFGHRASLLADVRHHVLRGRSPGDDQQVPMRLFGVLQACNPLAAKGALGRGDQHQALAEVQQFGQVGVVDRPVDQSQPDQSVVEHFDNLVAVAGAHEKGHLRVRVVESDDRLGQEAAGQRWERTDRDASALAAFAQARCLHAFVEHSERALDVTQKAFAAFGQRQPASAAYEQRAAYLLFERLDARADRGLCDIQVPRGPAEAALPRDALEGQELIGVHVPLLVEALARLAACSPRRPWSCGQASSLYRKIRYLL